MTLWALVLAALTVLRLIVAAMVPLSPDEAYYWVWSRALAPGYLDHPPMVALWIRAGTLAVGDTPLGIRLLAPLSLALGSWMVAQAADILVPGPRAGLIAAALLNATLLFGVGAVTMTPDTPLLFFWAVTLWALARLLLHGRSGWFLVAGISAGCALASKYTGVFLPAGIFLWLAAAPAMRFWLLRPAPWIAACLGAAMFLPVVLWNAAHGWASFAKQGGRTGDWQPARALQFVGELVGGQIGLATPLVFLMCAAGIGLAAGRSWRTRDPGWTLLAMLTLPPALVFLQHAFGDRVQGNWPAIIYPAAAVAAAGLTGRFWGRLRVPAIALGAVMTAAVYGQAAWGLLPLSPRLDPTVRMLAGWPALGVSVGRLAEAQDAVFVAADDYGIAAELARTVPHGTPVWGVEARWALFGLPHPAIGERPGLLVRSQRRSDGPDPAIWASAAEVGAADRVRDGAVIEAYRLFRVVPRPGAPAVLLPRPENGG
jgi:4-amino-4-deoxy-L-arabinose transferase-like glycosyltransferase